MDSKTQVRIASLLMLIAVALGALGAHLLKSRLEETGHLAEWRTAALYHMIHGMAMFVVALWGRRDHATFCFCAWMTGIFLFSGSLYVMSVTGSKALPIVLSTPLGGVAFIIGWACLVIKPGQLLGERS